MKIFSTKFTLTQRLLLLFCSIAALPLLAIADGKHNEKTCYAETAGGIEISSPCSSRKTTCNDDYTCSIDGVAGEVKDVLEMNKADIISEVADNPGDSDANKNKARHNWINSPARSRATDHNSSRSNKSSSSAAPAGDEINSDTDSSSTMATDYNSSRSNKADGMAAPDGAEDDEIKLTRATDYNSSRSNKSEKSGVVETDTAGDGTQGDADSNGGKAQDYNSSRSNRGIIVDVNNDGNAELVVTDPQSKGQSKIANANHNSTRSNKTKPVMDDAADSDDEDADDSKATDYNSSRSNKNGSN